jgi:hypothetical protein
MSCQLARYLGFYGLLFVKLLCSLRLRLLRHMIVKPQIIKLIILSELKMKIVSARYMLVSWSVRNPTPVRTLGVAAAMSSRS